jgi:hypothetical protein
MTLALGGLRRSRQLGSRQNRYGCSFTVLSQHVGLDIDAVAELAAAEGCGGEGVGDEGHAEAVVGDVDEREADAVDRD